MYERRLSVTNALIIINVVVFFVGIMVQREALLAIPYPGAPRTSIFEIACSYSWFTCFLEGGLWRLITYQFVHANFGHILFNMWALYFFGPAVENAMTPKRFLAFYLACGVAGALFSSLLAGLNLYTALPDVPQNELICNQLAAFAGYTGQVQCWEMIPLVGASAAIYGVMVACAFMYPDVRISLLFPPVTLRLRTFAIIIIALATGTILFNLSNAGGEAGHLGGIIMGAIIMSIWKYRLLHNRY
ncbi:MAG: rhomboid family intramembrane serine protease [Akkermansia sp.]|nr:rhomboid family intramembrane serine protease [Akkermansia sp.]